MKRHLPEWEELEDPLYEPEPGESPEDTEIMALLAQELRRELKEVPEPDESRMWANRSAFLTAGAEMAQEQGSTFGPTLQSLWYSTLRRFCVQALMFVLLIAVSITGAHVASSNSLPGDRLYGLKLALERVEGLFHDDRTWEAQLERRRREEVQALIKSGREAPVTFEGEVERGEDGSWGVNGVKLPLDDEQQDVLQSACEGSSVTVQGEVAEGVFNLSHLTPSCLNVRINEQLLRAQPSQPVIIPPPALAVPKKPTKTLDRGKSAKDGAAKPDRADQRGEKPSPEPEKKGKGDPPGRSKKRPGHAGDPPGRSKNPPGHVGDPPGQSKKQPEPQSRPSKQQQSTKPPKQEQAPAPPVPKPPKQTDDAGSGDQGKAKNKGRP